jgi:hypothetical protein
MAIDPSAEFPGQVSLADPTGYPLGKARNVTVPLDGTGTPWEERIANDILGFQQALLTEAGLTPTGVPDKVGASQYLDAIRALISPTSDVWTDVAAVTNFFHNFTDGDIGVQASSGRAILWNPDNQSFYSFNRGDSLNPTGLTFTAPYALQSSLTIDVGDGLTVHPYAVASNGAELMVIGGAPGSSSQSRYRVGEGVTFVEATSAKTAGTDGPVCAVYAGGTIEKFFMGYAAGNIESSADGVTWGNVLTASSHLCMAYSPDLDMIISVSGTTDYRTSTDGTSFTARTAPAAFHAVFWSPSLEAFIAVAVTGAAWYTSEDGINWTAKVSGVFSLSSGHIHVHEYKNAIVAYTTDSRLYYSTDGLATWSEACAPMSPTGEFPTASAIDPVRGTLCVGNYTDGLHLLTGRFGP